jgi:sugar/nucleoside kinase (ribokinase family)
MIEYATIGEITVDDTVMENGEVKRAQTGGGSVYSALGIRLWGHPVGINSVIGHDYSAENLGTLEDHQVATAGIHRIDGWSLRLWLLHEENNKKQQFPKLQSSTFQQLDEARPFPPESYLVARGFHLSPATPEGQIRSRDFVRQKRPDALISLDILTEKFISYTSYLDGTALQGIDIFTPSIVEIEALWPGQKINTVIRQIAGWGVRWIAIKMDTRGSIVHDSARGETYRIPIYPAKTVDPTGAGDSYSGGFLEGISQTGDVVEAGLRGTVSASFCVEHWGAFDMLNVSPSAAQERLAWLKQHVEISKV